MLGLYTQCHSWPSFLSSGGSEFRSRSDRTIGALCMAFELEVTEEFDNVVDDVAV